LAAGGVAPRQLERGAQAAGLGYVVTGKVQVAVGHAPIVGAGVVFAVCGKLAGARKRYKKGLQPSRILRKMLRKV
jgi:hypothetical protein